MTTTALQDETDLAPAAASGWPLAAAACLMLAGVLLAWWGGAWALPAAALAALGGAWFVQARNGVPGVEPAPTAAIAGRRGDEVMVSQVVPVWSRQLEVTRDVADQGLAQLLQTFTEMSGSLEQLTQNLGAFSVTAQPGAVDGAVRQESPALQALTAASERAFAERDAAVATLGECGEGLAQLQELTKQAREIARHTRLVAFNASIEANRHHTRAEGGSQAVAVELRVLAARMAETGDKLDKRVKTLVGRVQQARRRGEIADTTPDELRLEIDLKAREALAALLQAVGASLHGSQRVQEAGEALRGQIENAFMNFQYGDRVSQMMSIVANDMANFARWVAEHPHATQTDAAEWLAALEAAYTMDEQRSHHHGNVHVDREAGVEFF